jgi:hypothetical protein
VLNYIVGATTFYGFIGISLLRSFLYELQLYESLILAYIFEYIEIV